MAYVYIIYVNGIARYVGMGSGNRAWNYGSNSPPGRREKIKRALEQGKVVTSKIVKRDLTRSDALKFEDKMIVKHEHTIWNDRSWWNNEEWRERQTEIARAICLERNRKNNPVHAALKDPKKRKRILRGLEAGRTPEARRKQAAALSRTRRLHPELWGRKE